MTTALAEPKQDRVPQHRIVFNLECFEVDGIHYCPPKAEHERRPMIELLPPHELSESCIGSRDPWCRTCFY